MAYRHASIERPGAYLIFCLLRGGGGEARLFEVSAYSRWALIQGGRLFEGGGGGGGLLNWLKNRSYNFVASVYRMQVFLYHTVNNKKQKSTT